MDLTHDFTVGAPITQTWAALTDVPRVARCMPGAAVDESTTDPYVGTVTVRVGAVTQKFRGTISFAECDESARRLRMDLEGRDVRGASGASATLTMQLGDEGAHSTRVSVVTSLQLSGKVAQFGRAMLEDVSNAILTKFVANLEADLRGAPAPSTQRPGDVHATPRPHESPSSLETADVQSTRPGQTDHAGPPAAARAKDDVLDLGGAVGPVLVRRYGTVVLGAAGLLVGLWALIRTFGDPSARRRRKEIIRHLEAGWERA
ncbi:SRPBCC family protein [Pseudactinotalea sp. HY158]|uniref:SRPBCC family protein n=1 Tax=Pseudactinotalea sp. HY158 TaxID=2654547 RepID=UPI00129D0E2B|nr:SRPBCC family protein [Pseudactinotalea sp. HY158]QGH70699.1 carbon monoxide dehydrogenase [Pseudactinotalea sp. HY158]